MKQTFRLFAVALVAGVITLGGYKIFVESDAISVIPQEGQLLLFQPIFLRKQSQQTSILPKQPRKRYTQ